MSARLNPISGLAAKGPACFLVNTNGARIVLDLGYGPQPGLWPDVSKIGRVDALLLSHTHGDHAGGLKLCEQLGNPPVYATAIAAALLDNEAVTGALPLHGSTEICGVRITTGRSGHAPGGVWLHLDVDDGLLYTGDYSVESDVYVYDPPPPARTVILDASYGPYDTSVDECRSALDALCASGPILLPVPAAGRAADIALHVARSGRGLPHIDDSVRSVLHKLGDTFGDCVRPEAIAEIAAIARDAPPIDGAAGTMIASVAAGYELASAWEHTPTPAIAFTGYIPPGTPAERLTQSSRASFVRWNVHPRLSDNAELVRQSGARIVLPAFAKHHASFNTAFAPARLAYDGPIIL